jgi:hypothetical protein
MSPRADALEILHTVFAAILQDLRMLFNVLGFIIHYDRITRRNMYASLRLLEDDTYTALCEACEHLPLLPLRSARLSNPTAPAIARPRPRRCQSRTALLLPGPRTPRQADSIRTRKQTLAASASAPVPDSVHRDNLLRRFTRLVRILADPETALNALARRQARRAARLCLPSAHPRESANPAPDSTDFPGQPAFAGMGGDWDDSA